MPIYNNILECIGRTPLVRLARIGRDCPAALLGKVEMSNPGGSVKDRIALGMLRSAERDGILRPGDTIIEATAGNTGVALAMAAAILDYRCVFVLPEKVSRDKEDLLRAYGAEIVRTSNAPPESPENFQNVARRLASENGWFLPDQFSNPANPAAHYETTGPEIWSDTGGKVDALVCGVGSGGSLTGVSRYLKQRNPALRTVLADPQGSTLSGGPEGTYAVEGIGGSSKPPANYEASLVDEAIVIADRESFQTARRLTREEGLLVGGAAGCAVAAALIYGGRPENHGKTIVAILPDTGRNYLSKIYSDAWMAANGFD
jgi:cystathionine beta-synthase